MVLWWSFFESFVRLSHPDSDIFMSAGLDWQTQRIGNCHLAFKTGLRTYTAATYDRYPIGRIIAFSHAAVE